MATRFSTAALAGDGLSSDARMVVGSGYTPDLGSYALDLVRRTPAAARGARAASGGGGVSDGGGHRVQMRWRDLDGLGHVNHTVVLTYLEEGRDAFLAACGVRREEYVVGRCSVNFKRGDRSGLRLGDGGSARCASWAARA